jgi:hypothetical protein
MHCRPPHRRALQPATQDRAATRAIPPGRRFLCVSVDETCPISTEGWTRRVHFVREGGEGGVGPPSRAAQYRWLRSSRCPPAAASYFTTNTSKMRRSLRRGRGGGGSRGARQGEGGAASCARESCAQWSGPRATPRVADEVGEAVGEERKNPALPGGTAASGQGRTVDSQASAQELPVHGRTQSQRM